MTSVFNKAEKYYIESINSYIRKINSNKISYLAWEKDENKKRFTHNLINNTLSDHGVSSNDAIKGANLLTELFTVCLITQIKSKDAKLVDMVEPETLIDAFLLFRNVLDEIKTRN